MNEVFEHAYEGLCNSIQGVLDLFKRLGKCVLVTLVYLTIPFWVIPYAIYDKMKGGAE